MEYTKHCGCKVVIPDDTIEIVEIVYCPKHKAAPELYEALLAIINSETISDKDNFNNALEALAKAEEGK